MEPEEALLLPVIIAGRPVQVQVVAERLWQVALVLRPASHRIVRVAVTLRRGVAVVQVGQEGPVRRAEVLAVQVQRVLVEVVLEPDQRRLAIFGIDHRAGEGPVEAVDRAQRQRADGAGRVGLALLVEGDRRPAVGVDGKHMRFGERVLVRKNVDLVHQGIGGADLVRPDLVPLILKGTLLALAGAWRVAPLGVALRGAVADGRCGSQRLGDGQLVLVNGVRISGLVGNASM
jgi:hypothetical protein